MKTQKFDGVMENAYSKPLPSPIKFSGEYEAFENITEVREKNEVPSDKEIVDFVNNKRKANARQKSMQAALDAAGVVKPTLENDEQLRLRKMFDILVANGASEDEAKANAAAVLNLTWAE